MGGMQGKGATDESNETAAVVDAAPGQFSDVFSASWPRAFRVNVHLSISLTAGIPCWLVDQSSRQP